MITRLLLAVMLFTSLLVVLVNHTTDSTLLIEESEIYGRSSDNQPINQRSNEVNLTEVTNNFTETIFENIPRTFYVNDTFTAAIDFSTMGNYSIRVDHPLSSYDVIIQSINENCICTIISDASNNLHKGFSVLVLPRTNYTITLLAQSPSTLPVTVTAVSELYIPYIDFHHETLTFSNSTSFRLNFTSPTNQAELWINGSSFGDVYNLHEIILSDGNYEVSLTNSYVQHSVSKSFWLVIDTTIPSVLLYDAPNIINESIILNTTITDNNGISKIVVLENGIVYDTFNDNDEINLIPNFTAPGMKEITIRVTDNAGNINSTSFHILFNHIDYFYRIDSHSLEAGQKETLHWSISFENLATYSLRFGGAEIYSGFVLNDIFFEFDSSHLQLGSYEITLTITIPGQDPLTNSLSIHVEDTTDPMISVFLPQFDMNFENSVIIDISDNTNIDVFVIVDEYNQTILETNSYSASFEIQGTLGDSSNIELMVIDRGNNSAEYSYQVVWTDSVAPILSEPDDLQIRRDGGISYVNWSILEPYPSTLVVFVDGIEYVQLDNYTDPVYSFNLYSLNNSHHTISILMSDQSGNWASSEVEITIHPFEPYSDFQPFTNLPLGLLILLGLVVGSTLGTIYKRVE